MKGIPPMTTQTKQTLEIANEHGLILLRNMVRENAAALKFSTLEQTKLITAASELARNILLYAKNGNVTLELLNPTGRPGLKLTFEDQGPGIPDIKLALQNNYSTGTGLGLGLPGAKRLVNEFDIKSTVGKGTTITIIIWKHGR